MKEQVAPWHRLPADGDGFIGWKPMPRRASLPMSLLWIPALIALLPAPAALACASGYDTVFPATDQEVLTARTYDFEKCLISMGLPVKQRPGERDAAVPQARSDLDLEMQELRAALADRPAEALDPLLARYQALRKAMRAVQEEREICRPDPSMLPRDVWPAAVPRDIPQDLPRDVALYLQGAMAYTFGDTPGARRHWQQLLQLPEDQRRHRTVWASYMLGRSHLLPGGDRNQAIHWLRATRELAKAGFADSQQLATASLGWEARAELDRGRFESAMRLYWQTEDIPSLSDAAHAALKGGAAILNRLAADPTSVKVITALILSRGAPWRPDVKPQAVRAWLAAIERSGLRDVAGADRLAWGAYQHGEIESARRWLSRARPDSLIARWLQSKLLLREGRIDESAKILAGLVRDWPLNDEWNSHWQHPIYPADWIVGELSMLKLARGKYLEALDVLLCHCFFEESAYIADRVLTIEELKEYVDRCWPAHVALPCPAKEEIEIRDSWGVSRGIKPQRVGPSIRYLLARRLVRRGRHDEARAYFPPDEGRIFEQYLAALEASTDPVLSPEERGEQLWHAARIARNSGMELMGTADMPDFEIHGGWGGPDPLEVRPIPWRLQWADSPLLQASADERARVRRHHPEPDRRYHYRFIAAQHAWDAARMLPDESDFKAKVLCTAGNWIANLDPRTAQRFYRALVERCTTTKLAREARKRHWLPPSP